MSMLCRLLLMEMEEAMCSGLIVERLPITERAGVFYVAGGTATSPDAARWTREHIRSCSMQQVAEIQWC